jgi:fluoride ion exporter CrcB/FEX
VRVLLCVMDPTKLRMRYLLGIFLAAVLTAAVLRHVLHTQVGFAREDIRAGVLIAAAVAIFLLVAFFRWSRRQ